MGFFLIFCALCCFLAAPLVATTDAHIKKSQGSGYVYLLNTTKNLHARVEFPVMWDVTRPRSVGDSHAHGLMQTESYREMWALEVQLGGDLILARPGASIPVTSGSGSPERYGLPKRIVLSARDLGILLGIVPTPALSSQAAETDPLVSRLISLPIEKHRLASNSLEKSELHNEDIRFHLAEGEDLEVHLEVGSANL